MKNKYPLWLPRYFIDKFTVWSTLDNFTCQGDFYAEWWKLKFSRQHAAVEMHDVDSWVVNWLVKIWFVSANELTVSERGGISVRASWAASSSQNERDDVFIITGHICSNWERYYEEVRYCTKVINKSLLTVFKLIFNGSFEVECFNQSGLVKNLCITNTSYFYSLRRHSNT